MTPTWCNGISTPALTKLTGPRDPLSDACVSMFEFSVPQLIHEEQGRKLGSLSPVIPQWRLVLKRLPRVIACRLNIKAASEKP